MLLVAFLVLVVEGFFVYGWYDRYQVPDAASGDAPGGSVSASGATMPEGTAPEGTAPEGTVNEETTAAGEAPSPAAEGVSFVHTASAENSRGDYTYLSHPRLDGNPDAVVLAGPSSEGGGAAYGRNVGVWYELGAERWAIFNQDLAAVPAGSAFEVVVPPASESFVHRAAPPNTVGNATYLNNPLTNGEPDAEVSVTQNWNPGGGEGVYNDHPVGVLYDEDVDGWFVYNEDGAPIPEGAAFNVAVSGGQTPPR